MAGVNGSNTTIVTRLWHLGAPGIKLYTSLWLGTIGSTIWNFQHIKAYFGSLIYWDLLITVDTPVPFGTGKITGIGGLIFHSAWIAVRLSCTKFAPRKFRISKISYNRLHTATVTYYLHPFTRIHPLSSLNVASSYDKWHWLKYLKCSRKSYLLWDPCSALFSTVHNEIQYILGISWCFSRSVFNRVLAFKINRFN